MTKLIVASLAAAILAVLVAGDSTPPASAQQRAGSDATLSQPRRTTRSPELRDSGSAEEDLSEIRELEEQCLDAVNGQRKSRGLEPLRFNENLLPVARQYSRRMAEERFFDHADPGGYTVRDRVREAGIRWRVLGENLSFTKGYINPVAASMRGWMNSPPHRLNILEPSFDETAIGAWISSNGTVYFTEIFIRQK